LCEKYPKLVELLGMPPQIHLVLDTNAVFQELIFVTTSRRNATARSALREVLDSGVVVTIAPTKMHDEVKRHIPRLAQLRRVSEDKLRMAWIELQAKIEFREVAESAISGSRVADPYDLPFVRLYWTSGADAVLTSDKDISLMGAKTVRPEAMVQVRDYARSKSPEVTLRVGGVLVVGVSVGTIVLLLQVLGSALRNFSNLPRVTQVLLIGGALFAVIHPGTRRALASAFSSLASNLRLPARVLVDVFCELSMKIGETQLDLKIKESAVGQVIPRRAETSLNSSIESSLRNVFGKYLGLTTRP
jgi:predicted nucleic acid-binding protein